MVRLMKIAAFAAGALMFSAFPVFAQDLALPGVDLDPFHILTPAAPPAAAAAPAAEHHHHHAHHHASKH